MNATLDTTTQPKPAPTSRRRTIPALVAAVLMLVGLLVGGATPASAASPGTASVCFIHTNGGNYTYEQYAQRWTSSGWVNVASLRSNNGCTSWNLGSGHYWRFQAYIRVGRATFIGTTGYAYVRSGTNYNYGTHYVQQYGSN